MKIFINFFSTIFILFLIFPANSFSNGFKLNKAVIQPIDQVRDLVDDEIQQLLTSTFEIHKRGLSKFKLEPIYWTGYFWAMNKGLIGARFADSNFLKKSYWEDRFEYIKSNPPSNYIAKEKIFALSPSEKIELLIGDTEGNLTAYMWRRGKDILDRFGQIASWIGLCDGLALASTNFPFPKKSVNIWSFDGKYKIKFFPEDIKSLGTLLWKQGSYSYKIIGERCDEQLPEISENGRYTTNTCFNTNPGTFHLSLVNQIGQAKRSFIMDSMSNFEVWNYAIVGYSFKYLNPQTKKQFPTPMEATIPISEYANDKFSQFRSPHATHIVEIEAEVEFLREQYPKFQEREEIGENKPTIQVYQYDLELGPDGEIIGGEWLDNEHPDFLWIPLKNSIPKGPFDDLILGNWNPQKELLPKDWIEPALKSIKEGIVPHQIVKALFDLSNLEADGFNPN